MKQNYILIGLPTAGKSTLEKKKKKTLGYDYLDTDLLIQTKLSWTWKLRYAPLFRRTIQ